MVVGSLSTIASEVVRRNRGDVDVYADEYRRKLSEAGQRPPQFSPSGSVSSTESLSLADWDPEMAVSGTKKPSQSAISLHMVQLRRLHNICNGS